MLTDHSSQSGSNPPPPARPALHIRMDRRTYRLMVITLSVWYTALRATTRLKSRKKQAKVRHWTPLRSVTLPRARISTRTTNPSQRLFLRFKLSALQKSDEIVQETHQLGSSFRPQCRRLWQPRRELPWECSMSCWSRTSQQAVGTKIVQHNSRSRKLRVPHFHRHSILICQRIPFRNDLKLTWTCVLVA